MLDQVCFFGKCNSWFKVDVVIYFVAAGYVKKKNMALRAAFDYRFLERGSES